MEFQLVSTALLTQAIALSLLLTVVSVPASEPEMMMEARGQAVIASGTGGRVGYSRALASAPCSPTDAQLHLHVHVIIKHFNQHVCNHVIATNFVHAYLLLPSYPTHCRGSDTHLGQQSS